MLKFFSGVAIMCAVFAVFAVFFSQHGLQLASIYAGMGLVFLGIGFLTRSPKSRW